MKPPHYWRRFPPGICQDIAGSDAAAMVCYLPFLDTSYDVSARLSGSIEVCFEKKEEARAFFDTAVASGEIERAELRFAKPGTPRGVLVDEYTVQPPTKARRR